jgi:hypothetical protein
MTRFLPARIFSVFAYSYWRNLLACQSLSDGSQPVDARVKSLGRFQILGFLKTPFFLLFFFFFFFGSDLALRKSVRPSEVRMCASFYLCFENHGLNVGLALFRLGTRVGPAMQKNFNLSWKFFQIFRENLGL